MQKALHYRNLPPPATAAGGSDISAVSLAVDSGSGSAAAAAAAAVNVRKLVAENAVVVFARKGCCMCHVVKLLLNGHGVNPTVLDVDEQNEADVTNELSAIGGAPAQFPAVYVGGELFGGLEQVMGAHISGELVPRLRKARALWL